MPVVSAAWRAPATISPGARSPPMASTAMGSIASGVDVDRDSALVPPAGRAHRVRPLGRTATRADAAVGDRQLPRTGATASGLRFDFFFLGTAIVLSVSDYGCCKLAATPTGLSGRSAVRASAASGRSVRGRLRRHRRRSASGDSRIAAPSRLLVESSWSSTAQRSSRSVRSQPHGPSWRSAPQIGHRPGQSSRHSGASGAPRSTFSRTIGARSSWPLLDREHLGVERAAVLVGHGVALGRRRRPAGRRAAAGSAGTCRARRRSACR